MKKFLTLPALLLQFFFLPAQEITEQEKEDKKFKHPTSNHHEALDQGDVSIHGSQRLTKGEPFDIKVWALYHNPKRVVMDLHAGFHFKNTLDIGFGYNVISKEKPHIWVVPKLSILLGQYMGIAPGLLFRMEKHKWYVLTNLQYIACFSLEKPQAVFNFTEIGYSPNPVVEIGIVSEMRYVMEFEDLHFKQAEFDHEIGPLLRINLFKNYYIEGLWGLSSTKFAENAGIHEASRITIAIGIKFNDCN